MEMSGVSNRLLTAQVLLLWDTVTRLPSATRTVSRRDVATTTGQRDCARPLPARKRLQSDRCERLSLLRLARAAMPRPRQELSLERGGPPNEVLYYWKDATYVRT